MPTSSLHQHFAERGSIRLAREELGRIERQIGTGSARNATGGYSAERARHLNRLRYSEAVCRAHVLALEKAAA
jgi:hypothetical protein